jgi:hypothetical protein
LILKVCVAAAVGEASAVTETVITPGISALILAV